MILCKAAVNTSWLSTSVVIQTACIGVAFLMFLSLRQASRTQFKLIGLFTGMTFAVELVGLVAVFLYPMNLNLLANIYALFEIVVILLFYRDRISWLNSVNLFVIVLILLAFGAVNLIFIQGYFKINSYMRVVNSIVMILVIVSYYFTLVRQLPKSSVLQLPMFWVNTSFLLYFSGAFMAHLATDYIINVMKEFDLKTWIATWTVHNCIGGLSYFGLAYALSLVKKHDRTNGLPFNSLE